MEEILNLLSEYGPSLTSIGSIIAAAVVLIKEIKKFTLEIMARIDQQNDATAQATKEDKKTIGELCDSNTRLAAALDRVTREYKELKEAITHVKED